MLVAPSTPPAITTSPPTLFPPEPPAPPVRLSCPAATSPEPPEPAITERASPAVLSVATEITLSAPTA